MKSNSYRTSLISPNHIPTFNNLFSREKFNHQVSVYRAILILISRFNNSCVDTDGIGTLERAAVSSIYLLGIDTISTSNPIPTQSSYVYVKLIPIFSIENGIALVLEIRSNDESFSTSLV